MKWTQIVSFVLAFLALAFLAKADDVTSSEAFHSGEATKGETKVLELKVTKPSKKMTQKRLAALAARDGTALFSGRSTGYYAKPYGQSPAQPAQARDSAAHGTPINTSGYSATAAASSYSSPSYSAPSSSYSAPATTYDVPSYGEEYYEEAGGKNKAAAIAIPIVLAITIPLAVIGLIALFNLKALLTIGVISSLCTNSTFSGNFSNLCNIINNIGRSDNSMNISLKHLATNPNVSKLMSLVGSPSFNLMDYLKEA